MKQTFTRDHLLYRRKKLTLKILVHAARIGLLLLLLGLWELSANLGWIDSFIMAVLMIFALSSALATPGASSRAGLVFGNSEWISTGQAYFQGIISVVCVIIALLCVGVPLGMMIL